MGGNYRNACKIIKKDSNFDIREIQIHQDLDHLNVVPFLTCFQTEENAFIVMELCTNGSLSQLIDSQMFAEFDECRTIVRQILSGVTYLHSKNIIHRDLKPSNLLLDKKMCVKICDFGIAISSNASSNELKLKCGTPSYIAPEILDKQGAKEVSDVWSVGVITFYLYKGIRPFDRSNESNNNVQRIYSRIRAAQFDIEYYDEPSFVTFINLALEIDPEWRLSAKDCLDLPMFTKNLSLRNYLFIFS